MGKQIDLHCFSFAAIKQDSTNCFNKFFSGWSLPHLGPIKNTMTLEQGKIEPYLVKLKVVKND